MFKSAKFCVICKINKDLAQWLILNTFVQVRLVLCDHQVIKSIEVVGMLNKSLNWAEELLFSKAETYEFVVSKPLIHAVDTPINTPIFVVDHLKKHSLTSLRAV